MKMRLHTSLIALAAALAVVLVAPAHSLADYYVPPENSAANQYTESFPGAGGEKDGKGEKVTPADTLGARNAKRLEQHGSAGKEAAEVAAETAPESVISTDNGASGGSGGTGNAGGGTGKGTGGSGSGAGSGATAGANGGSTSSGNGGSAAVGQSAKVDQPEGSSGLSQVLGQATGVGDGNVGLWLPLVILLTLAGSIAYAVRSRQPRHGHSA